MESKTFNNIIFIVALLVIILGCTITISFVKENVNLRKEIIHLKFNDSIQRELLNCDSVVIDTTYTLKPLIK